MIIKVYIYIIFFSLNLFANEILFIDNFLSEKDRKLSYSLGLGFLYDNEPILDNTEIIRKSTLVKSFDFSLLLKRNNISFKYFSKDSNYNTFSLPFKDDYFLLSTNHYFLNKGSLKTNFDIYAGYLSANEYDYSKYILSTGVSKEVESSQGLISYYHLSLIFQNSTIGQDSIIFSFNYPMYLLFENKYAYMITPTMILDNTDIYIGTSFKFLF